MSHLEESEKEKWILAVNSEITKIIEEAKQRIESLGSVQQTV